MKKALVTGAGGFIGSHLCELLVEQGYQVRAFLHYNSQGNWGWLEKSPCRSSLEVVLGDIRDYDSVENAVENCEEIFHLAALIGIPYSYVSPSAYIKTNIEGTYNILQASRKRNVKQILVTSTSETYGTAQYVPIDEKHPAVGQSPYAATKIGADQLALSYAKSFSLPVKVVRPFNTFGPRQSARAIIPTIMTQALSGKKEIQLGDLSPTRDFTFVEDTVRGFLEISKSDSLFGRATNISMNQEISVRDLFHKISEITGSTMKVKEDSQRLRPAASEVERLLGSNQDLLKNTTWRPKESLDSGLLKTWNWLKDHISLYKSDIYNV